MNRFIKVWMLLLAAIVLLSACSSGGGGGGGSFTVSGTVSGLTGAGLMLTDNGADDLSVTADGAFTFPGAIANGGTYAVTVKTQPTGETCTVNNGSGTIAANVTDVSVTCSAITYAVGGTVSGLAGSGLVLQDNAGDDLTVSSTGAFTFGTKLADGAAYTVTVKTQPSNPTQTCTASSNTGIIAGADATTVDVVCSTNSYTVGGTVSGYTSSGLVLQNNGTDDKSISANGAFTFAANVASGANYAITVKTQPAGQTCSVSSGSGKVGGANVTTAAVSCTDNPKHTIGGSITGLVSTGLVLQDNGGDDLTINGNGSFTFATSISQGLGYNVTVKTQPTGGTCSVGNATGTVGSGNVTTVSVVCASNTYTVGGTVSGMSGGTLVLQDNGGDDLTITGNGTYTFATPIAAYATYNVTVKTQPAGQTCSVQNGNLSSSGANVTNVNVTCSAAAYTIGGMVSGLTGTGLVLKNNYSGETDAISGNGAFTFATAVADKTVYDVTVKTQPAGQTCSVTNESGTVSGANVSNITVACVDSYGMYVTITGLNGTIQIANNGTLWLNTTYNYTDTLVQNVPDGTAYNLTVSQQPTGQTCQITNGVGTVAGADVTNISVACAVNTYTVGGTGSGILAGKSLVLQNNGGDDLTLSGTFFSISFATKIAVGDTYDVTVKTQPVGELCTVSNGSGVMPASNVTDVSVICSATSYSVSGMASGVAGNVVIQNNGGDDLTVTGNGSFSFTTPVANFAGYDVTVKSSGPTQYCSVTNGSGTVSSANVTNVSLSCSAITEHFAFVENNSTYVIGAYPIDGTSGSIASSPTHTVAVNGVYSAIAPNGKFYFVSNTGANTVSAYSVNAATGAISSVASYATGTGPVYLAVDPTSSYLYVSNNTSNNVSGYTINGSTGALTEMSGSPFIAGAQPGKMIIDYAGTNVYVMNDGSSDISEYAIGTGGVLTPITGSPFVLTYSGQMAFTVSPDSKYAYIPMAQGGGLYVYTIDGSGAITHTQISGSPFATGSGPRNTPVFDPTGQYLYLSNYGNGTAGSGSISAYSVNSSTGALTQLAGSPYMLSDVYAWTNFVDSTGRFVFENGAAGITVYRRDTSTGQLTAVDGSPFLGTNHRLLAVTP